MVTFNLAVLSSVANDDRQTGLALRQVIVTGKIDQGLRNWRANRNTSQKNCNIYHYPKTVFSHVYYNLSLGNLGHRSMRANASRRDAVLLVLHLDRMQPWPCGETSQFAEHVLHDCPIYEATRRKLSTCTGESLAPSPLTLRLECAGPCCPRMC